MRNPLRSIGRALGFLRRDEQGSILVLGTLVIITGMGMIGLAIEGTRYFSLNSELQDLADAAALAGAKELDGLADARARAENRARTLLANTPVLSNVSNSGPALRDPPAGVRFYSSLVAPDSGVDATSDADATFIRVDTVIRGIVPELLRAVGATTQNQTSATATAGSEYVACTVQPLMLCNPFEPNEFTATEGQQFHFKTKSNPNVGGDGEAFAPGNFGLLDPPGMDSSGGPELRRNLAAQNPKFCYINNVSPRTGQAAGIVDDGVNVRFNMYPQGNTQGMDLTPAPIVTKGLVPNNLKSPGCNFSGGGQHTLNEALRMPRDTAWTDVGTLRIGTAGPSPTAKNQYWSGHYTGEAWPADAPTRYAAYLKQLTKNRTGLEPDRPYCAPTTPGDEKRRVISVAIVNCQAAGVNGNAVTNVRSRKYADFFITEPAAGGEVFAEFVRLIQADSDGGKLHHVVQLHR